MTMSRRFNDEKARAAVLLWAKVNGLDKLYINKDFVEDANGENIQIQFNKVVAEKSPYIVDVEDIEMEGEKPRPVIVGDIKYSSYEDYLKSRKEGK